MPAGESKLDGSSDRLGGCRPSGRVSRRRRVGRTDLAVATAPAMPEATAHAMTDTVPEFMMLGTVASVIRYIPITIGHISVTRQGAAIAKARVEHVTRGTAVVVGIGLRSSRSRPDQRSRGKA